MPEFDEEKQMKLEAEQAAENGTGETIRRASLLSPHLILGAITQFIYTGVQVAIASLFIFYASEVGGFTDAWGSVLLALGQMCFTIGRFVGAILMRWFKAEHVTAAFSVGAMLFAILAVAVEAWQATYFLIIILFFESIMFPTNFALATKDLGRNYKYGAPIGM